MNYSKTILLDTGVLYAFADKKDQHHLDAEAILLRCLKGDFGAPVLLDYVILETLTLLQQRGISSVIERLLVFLWENKVKTLFVTEHDFNGAMKLLIENERHAQPDRLLPNCHFSESRY